MKILAFLYCSEGQVNVDFKNLVAKALASSETARCVNGFKAAA